MKYSYLFTVLAILSLTLLTPSPAYAFPDREAYYAKVDYIVSSKFIINLNFQENDVKEIAAPPPPAGYKLAYMEITVAEGIPSDLVAIRFDRKIENNGAVTSLISFDGYIKLAYGGKSNLTVSAELKCSYIRTEWKAIPSSGRVIVDVYPPDEPFNLENLTVRVSVDNYAPYIISDVRSPSGESILAPEFQEMLHPNAVKADLKNLELNFGYGLEDGSYEVIFKYGEEYELPNVFLAKEVEFYNGTINAFETKTFTASVASDWTTIGYIVVLYSLHPVGGGKAEVYVEASMADYVYFEDKIIRIEGVSYLIPPLNFELWVKAYIVYGSWFKVVSRFKKPVNILYAPVAIKKVGEWTRQGVKIRVSENDIKDSIYAYLVVQLPSYGKIKNVITPGGGALGEYKDSLLPWASTVRAISVADRQAYIQIKNGEAAEVGTYFIEIEWSPIRIKAVDADGKPLRNAIVRLRGPIDIEGETGEDGIVEVSVYHPGIYEVDVRYKSVYVGEAKLFTITNTDIEIECRVYSLEIETVDMWGNALSGTEIVVKTSEGKTVFSGETGKGGLLKIEQIPGGEYNIEAYYKRIKTDFSETIDSSKKLRLELDVAFEIPFLGIPLSKLESIVATASTLGLGFTSFLVSRKKKKREEEEGLIELETFE